MAQHTDNQCDILTHIGCPQSVQKNCLSSIIRKKKKKSTDITFVLNWKKSDLRKLKNRQAYNSFGFGHLIKV